MSFNVWGVLFPLLFAAGLAALVRTIGSLLRLTDGAVVARAPARSGERLRVPEAGVYDLCLEGRTFSADFLGVRYSLRDAGGELVPIRRKLSRTKVSGLGSTRISVGGFELARGAELSLSVEGMSAQAQQRCSFVVQRPIGAGIAVRVVGLVLAGAATIGGMVGSVAAWLPAT
ncbi:hypothetical protein J5226_13365 [Lysobacter sp. K5869]|uniref:hypothetical protein n=1 Tax=Lysobacter sp. K5869 TaxID=2820808 RepID=UPI001C060529|nr:hypothetical protein [Lysobacter sp. K5869]QWP74680.1 hypothetical protein J5226_13365 [Lysobacter sp. K5869]